jgi:Xaa-Pro aminopeptidase|uniref:Aminopeptidase P family protein n=1 Tax=Desulfobacca acetoxidans TaxID=60893 RepID=A0A7V6DR76_9BACT
MQQPVPQGEISRRTALFQEVLAAKGIGVALIRQAADLYYYTGTVADGFLAVPAQGSPLFMVRRPQDRLAATEIPFDLAFYNDLGEIPGLLEARSLPCTGPLGLELDVLPAALYLRLHSKIFPGIAIQDVSPLIRQQRMIKSAYEIEQISRAAAILDEAYATLPELLRPGLTELELSATLEYRLRLLGHQGLVRVRNYSLELFFGHVLSGLAGLELAYTDTPSGGLGLSAAFPQGPSRKPLARGEPITVDIGSCFNGYVADMTRLYVIGDLPAAAWRAYDLTLELLHYFETEARPGVNPGDLYQGLCSMVTRAGLSDFFMGPGPERVSFVAHGVGLELDEFPFITARFPLPLAADMVLAFEPKFFLPEIGLVGLEDTGRITATGVQWLTRTPREVVKV